ncbi:MAG: hypothetical protein F7B17_08575 [Desulfurococcales archaeon]|nr:hypothetical protein [Desulfurococcales archaeon]
MHTPSKRFIQLRSPGDLFETIVIRRTPWVGAVVVCEGEFDERVLKLVAERLDFMPNAPIAVTHAGGVDVVPRLAVALVALLKLIRKTRKIAFIVDAEDRRPLERVAEILNEARRRGLRIGGVEPVRDCSNVYKSKVDDVEVYIAVSGLPGLAQFRKWQMEDHALKLKILEGKLDPANLQDIEESKQVVTGEEALKELEEASLEHVKESYNHIACLLSTLHTA